MGKKIAVSVNDGQGLDAALNPRFGRAPYYVLIDEEGNDFEVLLNPHADASHGAGPGVASLLRDKGATAVISGHFGPKAQDALIAFGIEMWSAPEGAPAREALEMLRQGELKGCG